MIVLVGILVGVVLLAVSATRSLLRNAPSRDSTVDLGSYGLVRVRFSTDPSPPLPTGTVRVSFMPTDMRGRPVELDSLAFEYGRQGAAESLGAAVAEAASDGSGMYMAGVQFPQVGNWWLTVQVAKGGEQAEASYEFYVEPAQ